MHGEDFLVVRSSRYFLEDRHGSYTFFSFFSFFFFLFLVLKKLKGSVPCSKIHNRWRAVRQRTANRTYFKNEPCIHNSWKQTNYRGENTHTVTFN